MKLLLPTLVPSASQKDRTSSGYSTSLPIHSNRSNHSSSSPRMTSSLLVALTSVALFLPASIEGHGYMYNPPSRNVVAKMQGIDPGSPSVRGVPSAEYCPHCLNLNQGLCGISEQYGIGGAYGNYDEWLDSTQQYEMPWDSQAAYRQGDVITIQSTLRAHHGGHMEVRACPLGRGSTESCMEEHVLTFVRDDGFSMPSDPNHPERGYYYGGAGWNGNDFAMTFQLPESLTGSQVLLQWRYITANSCSPVGYAYYFGSNPDLPDSFWNSRLPLCPEQLAWDGDRSLGGPELFFNCAEISILSNGDGGGDQGQEDPIDGDGLNDGDQEVPVNTQPPIEDEEPDNELVVDDGVSNVGDPALIAFMGNWLPCPTVEQYQQYTHVMVAFAVSYVWTPGKNLCSTTCEIDMPPICVGDSANTIVQDLHDTGKKILLSFGGAGMGGSWSSSQDDCWEYCFGRETQVVNRVTDIVKQLDLDGVDIDYEYFYEDNQRGSGFSKGAEAQYFLRTLTQGLRANLPQNQGYVITHTPMDIDLLPGTAYFDLLTDIHQDVDYVMPQYYNGITRPILDGVTGSRGSYPSTTDHFRNIAVDMFAGDASKVLAGFCIGDCAGTASNANGEQAAKVMLDLLASMDGMCPGGAFFWVATDDTGGGWSSKVADALSSDEWNSECSISNEDDSADPITRAPSDNEAGTLQTPAPTATPVARSTRAPTSAPRPDNPLCVPCAGRSSGECQKPQDGQCWPYRDPTTKTCYVGTIDCGSAQQPPSPTSRASPVVSAERIEVCGLEWDVCSEKEKACCPDQECVQTDQYLSLCRPKHK